MIWLIYHSIDTFLVLYFKIRIDFRSLDDFQKLWNFKTKEFKMYSLTEINGKLKWPDHTHRSCKERLHEEDYGAALFCSQFAGSKALNIKPLSCIGFIRTGVFKHFGTRNPWHFLNFPPIERIGSKMILTIQFNWQVKQAINVDNAGLLSPLL